DDAYKVYYEYDAVGNRRRMLAKYTDMVGYQDREQEYWYEYDALNRFTVSMGSLSGARATDPNDTSVSIAKGTLGGDGIQLAITPRVNGCWLCTRKTAGLSVTRTTPTAIHRRRGVRIAGCDGNRGRCNGRWWIG
ncbi:hypothetical protein M3655_28925, partial [Cytobacillus oceanisediminis]|nr:hypothetical protein [Cytobacillus oceanisediminis]